MAAFGTMLHGVNIDLGFIYVSQLEQSNRSDQNAYSYFFIEYDRYLYWFSTSRTSGHILFITARSSSSYRIHLDWVLCSSNYLGLSYVFLLFLPKNEYKLIFASCP
jgi:hypothetical protein